MGKKPLWLFILAFGLGLQALVAYGPAYAVPPPDASMYDAYPPFVSNNPPPLVMLVLGRDHKLYNAAYNDASDLNGDGVIDTTYKPDQIDYYGYFDSHKYYEYNSSKGEFDPVGVTADKKAPDGPYWSGDFLNYVTMSRMDAIRKVLYGGYRSTDTATDTVLQRAYIPQDAHTWGKEYTSIAHDGYDIRDYTPLDLPDPGTRHLFANTTLSDNGKPLMRVLNDSQYRIWEWVAIERPEGGTKCLDGTNGPNCATAGGTSWHIVPQSSTDGISDMTQTTYNTTGLAAHPTDHASYNTLVSTYATSANLFGSGTADTIDGSGNPFSSEQDHYMTLFNGKLHIPADGTYTFAVDGDDAVEFMIDTNGDGTYESNEVVAAWYGGHGRCGCQTHTGSVTLPAGTYNFQFRHEEMTGDDNYYLYWQVTVPSSSMTDYVVRVKVGDPTMPEDNCKQYPNGDYKPIGLLQRHGENNSMYFGLITGSYTNNLRGGVLRKNISSITDEINSSTGQFTSVNGIIQTINKLRIVDYDYSNYSYDVNCGWLVNQPLQNGECRMWGNPIGEMMYEGLRYFAGESPTPAFQYSGTDDNAEDGGTPLSLPKPAWQNPYATYPSCSKPFMLVISDINPSYDSDQLPGSYFSGQAAETIGAASDPLDVSSIGDMIYSDEQSSGDRFIGQVGSDYDGACTAKSVTGFGDIRGLCPEEPTKQGSYYSAAVAYYGHTEDMSSAEGEQKVTTLSVGLSSPLPDIQIPLQGKTIRLVPFAKSVGGGAYGRNVDPSQGAFQATNQIADFYVEELKPYYGKFRINFEDQEQGADYDMDAIVMYEYQLLDAAGNPVDASTIDQATKVKITLTSQYAAGSIIQHMGYIISGTTADGTYLEVRDKDTAPGTDVNYFLDTPNIPNQDLPLTHSRIFTVDPSGGASAASLLPNPLWYAAKWGGFNDANNNNIPDQTSEWDKDNDGVPDDYFYVVNPLKLEQQLDKSFAEILSQTSSGTASAVVANNSEGQGTMLQAFFEPEHVDQSTDKKTTWVGYLKSFWVDQFGELREDNGNHELDFDKDKIIKYGTDQNGAYIDEYTKHYHYDAGNQNDAQCVVGDCTTQTKRIGIQDAEPIADFGETLHQESADDRTIFTFIDGDGTDNDGDGQIDQSGEKEGTKTVGEVVNPDESYTDGSGELIAFTDSNAGRLKPFLGLKDDTEFSYLGSDEDTRDKNLIDYIRGEDSADLIGDPDTRSRTIDGKVWKLGDIVRSTPVIVSGAVENYDLIYNDESYLDYIRKYANRESVVYTGANDGMLHAFTEGRYYYDTSTKRYGYEAVDGTPIGTELWAYIPQALLPHLKWLADPDYGHSFYVDAKPKVFDARIFADDATHPNGWGTVLMVGLGAGGKKIWTTGDFGSGSDVVRYFYPTYVCMDVTNPRKPRLLWERSYPHLGMSTSYPAVVQVGATYDSSTSTWNNGKWYAVFGSGPDDATGKTDYNGYSDQDGHVFVVDVKTGNLLQSYDTGLSDAVMGSPTGLDKGEDQGTDSPIKGLTYNVDAIYVGAANYDAVASQWKGAMFKINTRYGTDSTTRTIPSNDPTKWSLSTLLTCDSPITAAPALSVDNLDNVWVFVGTGRFQEMADRVTTQQNYLFGIKDPYFDQTLHDSSKDGYYLDNSDALTLTKNDLFYANPYDVSSDQTGTITIRSGYSGDTSITTWGGLLKKVRYNFDGWYRELDARSPTSLPSERIITKPAILNGVVFAPAYIPDDDICSYGGSTATYGLYYETGTPMWKQVFTYKNNSNPDVVGYKSDIMDNTGPPPPSLSVHIGKESGATLFSQTGAGPVLEIQAAVPVIKSDIRYWSEPENPNP